MHLWCRLVWHRQCAKHHSTQSPRTEASLPWCHCIIVVNRLIVSTVLIVRWWFGLFPPMAFPSTTWYQNFLPLYGLKWGRPSQSSTRHKEKTGRCWGVGWTGWKVKDGRGQMRILMAWAFSFPQTLHDRSPSTPSPVHLETFGKKDYNLKTQWCELAI